MIHVDLIGDGATVATLGPLKRFQFSAEGIFGTTPDGEPLDATNDGVNPGLWVPGAESEHQQNSRGLVEFDHLLVYEHPKED